MCLWDFKLLPVDWILHLEVDFVLEILGQTQVILVNAESILVFAQDVQVSFLSFLEFLRYLQMASSFDFFPG
jgi:hypothetical protein